MGLDAYFYRKIKHNESASITSKEWANIFVHANDDMKNLLTRMKTYCESLNYSLSQVLTIAVREYLDRNECNNSDEIAYFRKFHFLNEYFNYTDENYAKDMIITKEQCIDLLNRAKVCLDVCNKVPYKVQYSTELNCNSTSELDDARNKVCNKHFPSKCDDATYEKIKTLYEAMCNIIKNTDWSIEYIVYNADW